MKRVLFSLLAMFAVGSLWAQSIYIVDVEVKQGGTGTIVVGINTDNKVIRGAQLDIVYPTGISVNGKALMDSQQQETGYEFSLSTNEFKEQRQRYIITNTNATVEHTPTLKDGALFNIPIIADASLKVDTELTATVTGSNDGEGTPKIAISGVDGATSYYQDDFTFKIKIVENMVVLDEEKSDPIATVSNTKVQVKRTINANEWSTICLPFAMTEEQVKEAFGENNEVKLAEFIGCVRDDTKGSLLLKFTCIPSAIEANHPYLIKLSESVTHDVGFFVENVSIAPENEPTVEISEEGARFIGIYAPKVLGTRWEPSLFLSENKFWVSKGTATSKAFRGHFMIQGLGNYLSVETGAKIGFNVDDETTAIEGIDTNQRVVEGVYDLQGRKVMVKDGDINNLQRGLYIINGKKVAIK